jgi:hypothetical protein
MSLIHALMLTHVFLVAGSLIFSMVDLITSQLAVVTFWMKKNVPRIYIVASLTALRR